MARLKKFVSIVFIIFVSIFICYKLLCAVGSLYIKKTIDRVSQGRVCVEKASIKFNFRTASIQLKGLNKNSTATTPIDFTGKVVFDKDITSIEIENGIYDDIEIVTPHSPLYIKNRTLHVKEIKLKLAEGEAPHQNKFGAGQAELSGKLEFSSQSGIKFDSVYETKNVDVQKLVSKFGIENLTFSGALDCKGNIRSYGKTIDERIKNLNGSLDIILNNGYLTRQHILVRMLTLINMYDVIKLRVPKMDKDGIKYNTAAVKAVIDSGIINVKSLCIDGDRIRISGKGNIDLVKKSTNMIFGIRFFQIIDEVLNKIPIVGYIITGEDGNLFAFYVRLKSGKDGLKATVVPHELLGDVTIRLFQRLLKLPLKMMTPITKSIKKKKNVESRR